jgi:galactonate dehydratase
MKITQVDVYLLDAGEQRANRIPIVCRVHTDEGIYGDGEAGIAYISGQLAAYGMVVDLAKRIIGKDPMQIEKIWENLLKTTFWGQSTGPIINAGISAIDIALWDIKGKALGVPVYQLLGGKCWDKLRCYASQLQFGWTSKIGPYGKTEDYVMITKHAMSEGYDAVKIDFTWFGRDAKPIPHYEVEGLVKREFLDMVEERMAAIRDECGYDLDIIVENHSRTDAYSALAIGELCDKYKMYAYEEPTSLLNPDMHNLVREKVRTPIASGERIYTRWGYYNYFKNNSIALIQPDVCNSGGLTETKKICDLAHIFDAKVQAHVAGGPISTAAALHLETSIPNFAIHEHHFRSTQESVAVLGKYNYQPVDGYYSVPELPGLGQEISDFALKTALKHECIK